MSLIRWTRAGNDPFTSLQSAMNELFEDFTRATPATATGMARTPGAYVPRFDVGEDEKEIVVTAELPGLEEKDVDVSLAAGMLTIRGEKKQQHEEKGKTWHACERTYGAFQRSVRLPAEVDMEKSRATFKSGVLEVTLPKTAQARDQVRKITVKAG